jgi:hypothetical protein
MKDRPVTVIKKRFENREDSSQWVVEGDNEFRFVAFAAELDSIPMATLQTPRTDAHIEERLLEGSLGCDYEFTRQLERELASANERLACARAETVEECAQKVLTWGKYTQEFITIADELRAIATVPPSYVCVPVDQTGSENE